MINFPLTSNDDFNNQIKNENEKFLTAINNNELDILNLIKLNLEIEYKINNISDFHINNFGFNQYDLIFDFSCDQVSSEKIKNIYYNTKASCWEDAIKNFNKYKITKYYLLPVDFEIKVRSFKNFKMYLLEQLKQNLIDKIIFDYFKNEWTFVDTLFYSYQLHNQKVKTMNHTEKVKIIETIIKNRHP